jgi:DNA phosphorothioation-dependent restriction protein DptH
MIMTWSELHSTLLGRAFQTLLRQPDTGAMAFVRCLTPDVVEAIARDNLFHLEGWRVLSVADSNDSEHRTITADQAVEIRESKVTPTLLLVDTTRAGAGMDGIYSAVREIDETVLFKEALQLASEEITKRLGRLGVSTRLYSERAVKKARRSGNLYSVPPWTEFDFYVRIASENRRPGELVWMLGLWPIKQNEDDANKTDLDISLLFVDRLLGTAFSCQGPSQKIESLRLLNPTPDQIKDLERFLRASATRSLRNSLEDLAEKPHLWINELVLEGSTHVIQDIELEPWVTRQGKISKWSGLIQEPEDNPPVMILDPHSDKNSNYSRLEIRWKARPDNLEKDGVQYQVSIVTDMDETLASKQVSHSSKKMEKCQFTNDDFSDLSDDALINAKIVVSVNGDNVVEKSSDEFIIRFGNPPQKATAGVGKIMRTFSEGIIEHDDRDIVTKLASDGDSFTSDSKNHIVLRSTDLRGKSFRVYRPPLIHEVERDWSSRAGEIGRWRVKVRASGDRAGEPEFVPLTAPKTFPITSDEPLFERVSKAARIMAERFGTCGGGAGQIYDQKSKDFEIAKQYILSWTTFLEKADPQSALANTVEIQSLSGRTIGLIVLPSHPLRVAWHVAYDNLVLHTRFEQKLTPKQVREELALLDGAMFPAFLPGLKEGESFVFADTLGFHAVGMVSVDDREPKASIAILARALGQSESDSIAPTVGRQSARVLGEEILKYIDCHNPSRLLHIHALRPGDGLTISRSLGHVQEKYRPVGGDDGSDQEPQETAPSFVLELYPSEAQRGVAGRFIANAREKRRSGAGKLLEHDQWMLDSSNLPGGMSLPRLRWARKEVPDPKSAAHLAVAFDTFLSRVVPDTVGSTGSRRPFFVFGLMSFFERAYTSIPSPIWSSSVVGSKDGEKHPADRVHTDRLVKIQQFIQDCVARSLDAEGNVPVLRTEISAEKADGLRQLHSLCDWVITLDRNAGIEYFDSPGDNREIYDSYIVDCVPEREDLGCLQLITSTSNLEEVRNLIDTALERMSLIRSRSNAEFLVEHLKALSGRLAIRLTGQKAPTADLIALAMYHANCLNPSESDDRWTSLRVGFLLPIDDIRDLLPPIADNSADPAQIGSEGQKDQAEKPTRSELIYVSSVPRKGLMIQFIDVKYRPHLRTARSPETMCRVQDKLEKLRKRWDEWYGSEGVSISSRAIRRAKLARVLRFYADKARRHADDVQQLGLSIDAYKSLIAEIDRLIEKGGEYSFASIKDNDRGWIFCPEYAGARPLNITPDGWDTKIIMFGPPSMFRGDSGERSDIPARVPELPKEDKVSRLENDVEGSKANNNDTTLIVHDEVSRGVDENTVVTSVMSDDVEQGFVDKIGSSKSAEENDSSVDLSVHHNTNLEQSVLLGTNLYSGEEVRWSLTVKGNPHLLVVGQPGMGKTTCLLNVSRQMLEFGVKPIIFSYHQDIDDKLCRMVGKVRFVDFAGLSFNPLKVTDRGSRNPHLDVASSLRDIFISIFPELGNLQGEFIRNSIKASFMELGWGDDPSSNFDHLVEPEFARFVEILRSEPKPNAGLKTLLARLQELEDFELFRAAQSQESLWDSDEPVVLRIHSTQNEQVQKVFASLVFYGLYKDMFRRGIQKRITHSLIFDEAHRAAKLNLIPRMAKECRKFGISLVLASQEARDFDPSLFSAIANYLVLRVTEADAKAVAKNVSTSDQERSLADRIKQLVRYRAIYCCEGQKKPVHVVLKDNLQPEH